MDLAQRVLVGTAPGRLTAVVGRPASGVSGLLSKVVSAAASNGDGTRAVLASWERSATRSVEAIGTGLIAVPEIVNWNVDELARCRELIDAPERTVVAVDYLQLIGPADETAVALGALASLRRWRVVLGVMAPRDLAGIERGLRGRPAIRAVAGAFAQALNSVSVLVVLSNGSRHSATVARRAPAGHWTSVETVER